MLPDIINNITIKTVRRMLGQQLIKGYLLGAAVRDLFLGINPKLYHFVLDNDPFVFAQHLATCEDGCVTKTNTGGGPVSHYTGKLGNIYFSSLRKFSINEYLENDAYFTIDSLAVDLHYNDCLDLHNGVIDLYRRRVRAIEPITWTSIPHIGLRAVSLATAHDDLLLAHSTFQQIKIHKAIIARADPLNVGFELSRILASNQCIRGIELLSELGLLTEIYSNFLPQTTLISEKDVEGFKYLVSLYKVLDALIPPDNEFLNKHILIIRQAALLSQRARSELLNNASGPDQYSFIKQKGDALELELSKLILQVINVFRLRIISLGYLRGVSLLQQNGYCKNTLQSIVKTTINEFGLYKGLMSTVLICADWVVSGEQLKANNTTIEEAKNVLHQYYS